MNERVKDGLLFAFGVYVGVVVTIGTTALLDPRRRSEDPPVQQVRVRIQTMQEIEDASNSLKRLNDALHNFNEQADRLDNALKKNP